MITTRIIAIDPGPTRSGLVVIEGQRVIHAKILANEDLLPGYWNGLVVCEEVASYGMPVGRDVFQTVRWSGRFEQRMISIGLDFNYLPRLAVKMHLCKSARAKDSNIRQAILDLYPRTGGGKTPQVGTKPKPGPLYGIKAHLWAALALAITWRDTRA